MGQLLNSLSLSFIEKKIEDAKEGMKFSAKRSTRPSAAKLRQIFAEYDGSDTSIACASEGLNTDYLMELAALEQARGAEPEYGRGIYRSAAAEWEPVIGAISSKLYSHDEEIGNLPSYARELQQKYGAKVTKKRTADGTEYRARYRARPAPFQFKVLEQVLPCAAISGDQKLARRLARGYHVDKPHQIDFTTARYVVLRHLLAGEDAAAIEVAKRVKPGYLSAFPPPLIEFPLGVVRNDPKLLLKGVKALSTRFKGRWDERKLQQICDKAMSNPAMRWVKTREKMLDMVRGDLISQRWLLSTFALAYLNVAAWRGMEPPFGKPEAFSEWVPLSLIESAGNANG